ncbi:MAG: hypothetical protein Q9M40_13860 [Sulfurimonas sp.]|nr:hypothetical protein [Sulfurimonas sp.]
MLYAQKVTKDGLPIGVLCLCFKFENELEGIFSNLSHNGELIAISDTKGVLVSNTKENFPNYTSADYSIIKNSYLSVTTKTSGYQGYNGIEGWFASVMLNVKNISFTPINSEESTQQTDNSNLLSDELNTIINKANDVVEYCRCNNQWRTHCRKTKSLSFNSNFR